MTRFLKYSKLRLMYYLIIMRKHGEIKPKKPKKPKGTLIDAKAVEFVRSTNQIKHDVWQTNLDALEFLHIDMMAKINDQMPLALNTKTMRQDRKGDLDPDAIQRVTNYIKQSNERLRTMAVYEKINVNLDGEAEVTDVMENFLKIQELADE